VSGSNPVELLTDNLPVIDRAVAFACRRYRFDFDDAEEFAAIVRLKLVENDYAILDAYEGRSSFATFISIVVQRMALDFRIHMWGKWHASAEAKRLGPLAIRLEELLRRDGRTLEEATAVLGEERASLEQLASRLPDRGPRRYDVALDEAASIAVTKPADVEAPLLASDRRRASEHLSNVMSALLARLPDDERLIFQLRFEGGMTVAQIARALQLDQKVTYRRIERRMREIKDELQRAGINPRDALDLIGNDEALIRFDLGKQEPRPSIVNDERAQAQTEAPQ
jgi:RNA polymerase sigma factor (sigma-70 family)